MDTLQIPGTYDTPEVQFDPLKGSLLLKGRSFSENSAEFFHPLINWLDDYIEMPVSATKLTIDLDVIDEASLKFIADILTKLASLSKTKKVQASWLVEKVDEDTREVGESLRDMVDMPFEITYKDKE